MKNKIIITLVVMACSLTSKAQFGIGTTTPNANAALDLVSTSQGMLFPRMTGAQRDAIVSPAKGLTIFNTTLDCIQTNIGTSAAANWKCLGISPTSNGTAIVSAYTCSTASVGNLIVGINTTGTGITQTITATVTIVGTFSISTTANGVTFAGSGTFAGTGAQPIVLTATGTPTAATASPYSYTLNTTPNCSFSRTTLAPLPNNITLSAIGSYFVASVYDQDYLPYTAPTVAASLATAQAANGTNETTTLNIQGILTTTGITLKIPYTVSSGTVNLQSFTQTINVPASYTQDGIARDVTFSYAAQNSLAGSSTITATLKAVVDTLKAKKLDIQTGIGNDNLGWLMAQFTYATNNSSGTANFDFRSIAAIPDRNIADAAHVMFYMPVLGADGKTWLNNNLGANYANTTKASFNPTAQASSSSDFNAYGSLYQWGRYADGHELITWTNASAGTTVNTPTPGPSSSTTPGSGFLTSTVYTNWYIGSNPDNLWQVGSGTNNPCPIGFRLPTETELENQRLSWTANNAAGALASPLKLSMPGSRVGSFGQLSSPGMEGLYWCSKVNNSRSNRWFFNSTNAAMNTTERSNGNTVRCIEAGNPSTNGTAVVSGYNCNTNSAGTMTAGTTTTLSGVSQTITATVTQVGSYDISTTANGVTFSAIGNFANTGNRTIELIATGTPTYGTTDAFTLNTTPNCSFNRTATGNASTNGTAIVSAYTCSTASAGTLAVGTVVSGVTQTITATVGTAGTYSISTTTANGVTFAGSGSFAGTGAQNIVLTATGAPTAAGTHTFTLNTTPNCNFSRTTITVPGAPTNLVATAGNTQASVAFTAPLSNGGSAITGYRVTSSPGSFTATGASSPLIVSGLTNGTEYTFTVVATNVAGNSVAASAAVTPRTVPGAPTSPVATAGNAQASIAFVAPVYNGGSAITSYTITSSPGSFTATGASSPLIVTGLTNGTAYTFTAVATNAAGNSVASLPSLTVTPRTVPGAPTNPIVTSGSASASVAFTAPVSNGGIAITGYTVTSSPGSFTATGASSPIVVTGLTNGIAYTFTVVATNAAGNSVASTASAEVKPSGQLGSTYTAYSNGSQFFSANSTCSTKSISAQGCGGLTTVTGASSTVYALVNINGQCWMTTNLKEVSTSPISNAPNTGSNVWLNTSQNDNGYWGYYNTSTTSGASGFATTVYAAGEGLLYQWSAAMNNSTTERAQGVCPSGFHVPSDCEWMYIEHGQGMSINGQTTSTAWRSTTSEGNKLRSVGGSGATLWNNSSGFTALLAGERIHSGQFANRGVGGAWWSSSETQATVATYRYLLSSQAGVYRYSSSKAYSYSVRCLKD